MTKFLTLLDQPFPFHLLLNRVDSVIGASSTQTARGPSGQDLVVSSQNANNNSLALEINVMSSDKGKNPKKPGGKKKGKNNKKKQENSNPEKSSKNPTRQKKPCQPCFICDDKHWMKDCPHKAKVAKFLKN